MPKRKILIVDDENDFTTMVKLNLEATGRYDVMVENIAVNAVNAALGYKPDLILLDVIMPGTEGPDIVSNMKEHAGLRDIPIVFLTATVRKAEVEQENGEIGGHVFIAKPCSLTELIDAIENQFKDTG